MSNEIILSHLAQEHPWDPDLTSSEILFEWVNF